MVKELEIESFMQSKLVFANNAISLFFFFFFLIIDLHFLVDAIIAQIFDSIVELIIPSQISIKEAKTEMEIHIVIAKAKVSTCSM